jgi:hypothetical protein
VGSPSQIKRSFGGGSDYGVPANVIWPTSVIPVNQGEPDKAFGNGNPFIYSIPGASVDISTQIAFIVPEDNSGFRCRIGVFELNLLWGQQNPFAKLNGTCELTVYAYAKGEISISPNDTWNQHPVVDFGLIVAKGLVSCSLHFTFYPVSPLCNFHPC